MIDEDFCTAIAKSSGQKVSGHLLASNPIYMVSIHVADDEITKYESICEILPETVYYPLRREKRNI
jgi:hypothetical protein